jgi:hypothetical protein
MRTNTVADLFKSGLVWAPLGSRWVEQVRDEMAAFPNEENDDLHDDAVYVLLRILQGGLMGLSADLELNIRRGGQWNTIEPGGNSPLGGSLCRQKLTTVAIKNSAGVDGELPQSGERGGQCR